MTRLFVAAWPTSEVVEMLADIARPSESGVRWVSPANWHITLRFVGEADPAEVGERLSDVTLPHVVAQLGPAIELLGARQAVVPVEGVDQLAMAVRAATAGSGMPDRHRFRGHLTLARFAPGARTSVLGARVEAELAIAEISLVASDLRPDGPIYTTLARFPTT